MSRVARALHRFCAGRPCRVIPSGGAPYMIRVYLGHWRGWRLYLHRFVTSDGERWVHDHPFDGFAVVLTGGYIEEVLPALGAEPRGYQRRWFNRIPRAKFHRVSSVLSDTWTLFLHGPHRKHWGFLEPIDLGGGRTGTIYHNPHEQSDSAGAHWWARDGVAVYPPDGVR